MPSGYGTILVALGIGPEAERVTGARSNARRLRVAHDLALRHGADVVGIGVAQPPQFAYGDGYVYPDLVEQDRSQIDADLAAAATAFHAAFAGYEARRWQSFLVFTALADKVADEARSADLIVTGPGLPPPFGGPQRLVTADLIMQAGRPVLVVPDGDDTPALQRVLVGWKDTRETRRAIADALPLLQTASHVCLLQVAASEDLPEAKTGLAAVAAWLGRHGIVAECLAAVSAGSDAAKLEAIAIAQDADLVVAGAYGHSRVREWALGGVTRTLLHQGHRCTLLSH